MFEKYENFSIFYLHAFSLPLHGKEEKKQFCKDCGLIRTQNGGSEMCSRSVDKSSFINADFNKANSSACKFIFK